MIKSRYQKMYTGKYKQDMDFVIIGERYIGPFVDMNTAQKAVDAINEQLSLQPKNRTRTEYEKVKYNNAWKAAKDHEERKLELWRKSDLAEAIKGDNWKAIQSPSEAAQYHFDLYVKVEKEINWKFLLREAIEKSSGRNIGDGSVMVGTSDLTDEEFLLLCHEISEVTDKPRRPSC